MKQYSRIFSYLGQYKGKIVLYFLSTFLSIIFSIVSIGMLMPFLQLIFLGNNAIDLTSKNPIVSRLNDFLNNSLSTRGNIQTLGYICILIVIFILLKNLFLY